MPRHLAAIAVLALTAALPVCGAAASTPREIVTRNGSGPVIVWDATPQIDGFIAQRVAYERGLAQLKVLALAKFVGAARGFARTERHLSVMVVYARSGAISSRYQTKSFQGVGDVLTLEGSPRVRLSSQWHKQAERGHFPAGIAIHVSSAPAQPAP